MTRPARHADAGFTLVEVLVALALLALISLAALTVLTSLVQTNERTADAINRISRLQRALFLLTRDFDQAREIGFDGAVMTIQRPGPPDTPRLNVRYRLSRGTLTRQIGVDGAAPQHVLINVQGLEWRFLAADGRWRQRWASIEGQPRAVELKLVTPDGPHDRPTALRRLFSPPAAP